MKFSGGTLYAWAYLTTQTEDEGSTTTQGLVTINTTTGLVTPVGTFATATLGIAGLAVDSNGNMVVAANGAGFDPATQGGTTDQLDGATGEFDSVNTTSGATTSVVTLDWPLGAPVRAMAYVGTTLVGVVDNGYWGQLAVQASEGEFELYGEEMVVIDTGATGSASIVNPAFNAPTASPLNDIGAESHISSLDIAPTTLTISRTMPRAQWQHLGAGVRPSGIK
jgi:hypothetical protein